MVSARWAVISVTCAAAVLVLPGVASASCAGTPAPSPYAFVGTVERTESADRLAVVHTEDGGEVEVRGGETRRGISTSNDRTYEIGAKYEFHPVNDTSPFEDGACTATRLLTSAAEPPELTAGLQSGGEEPASIGSVLPPVVVSAAVLLTVLLALPLCRSARQRVAR